MNKIYTTLLIVLVASFAFAQERYLDEVFSEVEVTTEVYTQNATVLFLPVAMEAVPIPIPMDIYKPVGDTETERPVVMVFHTGNFLPNVTNGQIPGTRQDSSVVEICTRFAKRGYVAVSCDYRTGWNPLAQTQPERALGLIQAAYRGVQDGRTAVRYMRFLADNGNPHGIDPSRIAALGQGTGGYLVLGMVGLSDYSEILTTTNPQAKFLLDTDGDQVPETPMVIQAFHGDINGEVLTVTPADGSSAGFGLPPLDTTNYPSHVGFDNSIQLGINLGGALGDISWLDDNTTPTISIQHPFDIFAPYDDAVLIVPTTGDPIVQVQGALQIGMAQQANGANSVFSDNVIFDDPITQLAKDNSAAAGHDYYEGVFPFLMPPNSAGIPEGVVVDWWDPNAPSPADGAGMGIPWNLLPHPSGGTFHDQGLVINEGMSAAKAKANIDLCMQYILPRACVALDLPCAAIYSSSEDLLEEGLVEVTPNPASSFLDLSSEKQMKALELYDMQGRMISRIDNINSTTFRLTDINQISGMHILNIRFEDGIVSKTIVIE